MRRMITAVLAAVALVLVPTAAAHASPPTSYFTYYVTDFTITVHSYAYDLDGTITSHLFDFGDNTWEQTVPGGLVNHTYSEPGWYTVALSVLDDDLEFTWSHITVWISGVDSW